MLGIDPGIERLGYAVVDETGCGVKLVSYGLISTEKRLPKEERFKQIYDDVVTLIRTHNPIP
jgi:crossover junction endodeoxyribonuclease RuvC